MIDFPLHTFLASLEADEIRLTVRDYERIGLALRTGGAWTLTRLRDTLLALLAKNEEQRDRLTRRFNEFFPPRECGEVDIARILEDLRRLARERQENTAIPEPPPQTPPAQPLAQKPTKPLIPTRVPGSTIKIGVMIALYLVFFVMLGVRIWQFWPQPPQPAPTPTATPAPTLATPSPERMRLYSNAPNIKQLPSMPIARSRQWLQYAAIAVCFLAGGAGYGVHLKKSRKTPEDPIPEDHAPEWNPDGPRHFPLGSIGGQPAPRFETEALNQLADSMGYFLSQQPGRVLNVAASIEATLRAAGAPTLRFFRRRQARSLLILEDALAEPLIWNSLAAELAEGMRQRGVPVLYGQFTSTPEHFTTEDGRLHRLEDLEGQRRGYLLLLFTDGKRFARPASRFALESLARWPMSAWMELRDPQFWDDYATIPLRHGFPIYPATPQGVTRAVRRFLTELGAEPDFSQAARHWQEHTPPSAATLEAEVEQTLGDALIWAQDCAMLQPLTPGLADALRRRFHPHLPYERLERLYALPGTSANVSGLRFAEDVLKTLRRGFLTRRDEAEQEAVLRFLIEKIEEAEPESAEDSLAHFAWEAVKERVRLELEADHALERLAQLAKSPVGEAIKAGLENFGLPGEAQDAIPLRIKPRSRTALRRLKQLVKNVEIPQLQTPPPLNWRQRFVFATLVLACVAFCGLSVYSYVINLPTTAALEIIGLTEAQAQLEIREAEAWRVAAAGDADALQQAALRAGSEYRLTVYGEGTYSGAFTAEAGQIARLEIERIEEFRPCQETFPQRGLTIQRCPDSQDNQTQQAQLTVWQADSGQDASQNRWLSVGLEISDMADSADLRDLRNLLLQSGTVDLIYRIHPTGADSGAVNGQQIDLATVLAAELDAWTARSQLIWWQAIALSENVVKQEIFTEFAENRNIGQSGANLSWVAEVLRTLESGGTILTPIQASAKDCWANPVAGRVCQEETTGMEFVWIEGGTFWMGCGEQETECDGDEKPRHQVTLDGFWMGKTEVTQEQWQSVMEENPAYFDSPKIGADTSQHPVEYVSWDDVQKFITALNERSKENLYRLPSEAEWEYACRAGTTTAYYFGNDPKDLGKYAWYSENADGKTHQVAQLLPNDFGLYDMSGNVWEWVEDIYISDVYAQRSKNAPVSNPVVTSGGSYRVLRGGSWGSEPRFVRSANRFDSAPSFGDNSIGFRVVRTN